MKEEFIKIVTDLIEIGNKVIIIFEDDDNLNKLLSTIEKKEYENEFYSFITNKEVINLLFKAFGATKNLSKVASIYLEKDKEKQLLKMMDLLQKKYNKITKQDDNI